MQKTGKREKKKGLVSRALTGDTSLIGSARSVAATVAEGASVVSSGFETISADTRKVFEPPRIETFESACKRLNIKQQDLPKIHNQIVLQVYTSFFTGLIALVIFVNYLVFYKTSIMVYLATLSIGMACMGHFVSASMQSMRIRKRKLGLQSEWLAQPAEWLPSRIEMSAPIPAGDGRLDKKMVRAMVSRSRRCYGVTAGLALFAVLLFFVVPAGTLPGAALLTLALAGFQLSRAMRCSLFVLQARAGIDYDFMYWLISPGLWVPQPDAKPPILVK